MNPGRAAEAGAGIHSARAAEGAVRRPPGSVGGGASPRGCQAPLSLVSGSTVPPPLPGITGVSSPEPEDTPVTFTERRVSVISLLIYNFSKLLGTALNSGRTSQQRERGWGCHPLLSPSAPTQPLVQDPGELPAGRRVIGVPAQPHGPQGEPPSGFPVRRGPPQVTQLQAGWGTR